MITQSNRQPTANGHQEKSSGAVSQRAPGGLEGTRGHPGEGELGSSCLGTSKVRGSSVAKTGYTQGHEKA